MQVRPTKGRKVWKVGIHSNRKLISKDPSFIPLFDGKMFATKEAAEKFAFRVSLTWTEYFGEIDVWEYTCTGEEWGAQFIAYLANPPRRKRARSRIRARR